MMFTALMYTAAFALLTYIALAIAAMAQTVNRIEKQLRAVVLRLMARELENNRPTIGVSRD